MRYGGRDGPHNGLRLDSLAVESRFVNDSHAPPARVEGESLNDGPRRPSIDVITGIDAASKDIQRDFERIALRHPSALM